MRLQPGEWFMWQLDRQLPDKLTVWKGAVLKRKYVATISKHTALALWRWYGNKGLYYSYMTFSGLIRDVRVCGDVEAWFGDEPMLTDGPKHD